MVRGPGPLGASASSHSEPRVAPGAACGRARIGTGLSLLVVGERRWSPPVVPEQSEFLWW